MKKSLILTALCAALTVTFVPGGAVHAQPPGGKVAGVVSDKARKQLDLIADQYYESKARYDPVGATTRSA
jgi:hypothetical protein